MILNDSSNLMNNKADITLGDLCRPQREEIAYADQEDDEW